MKVPDGNEIKRVEIKLSQKIAITSTLWHFLRKMLSDKFHFHFRWETEERWRNCLLNVSNSMVK